MDRFLRRITPSITTDTGEPASKRSKSDACNTSANQSCSTKPRRESDEPDITPESVNVICQAASEVDILSKSEVINHVADFVPQNAIDFDENSTQASATSGVCNPRPAGHNPTLQASQCGPRRWQDKKIFF